MLSLSTTFAEVSRGHIDRLNTLIDRGSVPRLRRMYQTAAAELERKLVRAVGSGASPFTIHQHQALLAQVRHGLARTSAFLGADMGAEARRAQIAAARATISDIKKLEAASGAPATQLPIEQASRFMGVIDKRSTSLLSTSRASMARYGSTVVARAESALSTSLLTGEAGYKAVQRVADVVEGEWWRAERIARTETAWAYNATQADAIGDAAAVFTDLWMRWTEMVADVTLSKLDTRVGDDSCAMHGQLARPGDVFGMPSINPPNLKISDSLLGGAWSHPPNRPNDRAVLQPWRPGWGWGWVLTDGGRGPAPEAPPRARRR